MCADLLKSREYRDFIANVEKIREEDPLYFGLMVYAIHQQTAALAPHADHPIMPCYVDSVVCAGCCRLPRLSFPCGAPPTTV